MSVLDLSGIRAELEHEREWRERELRMIRNMYHAAPSVDQEVLCIRSAILFLYAHMEGLTKFILQRYVHAINSVRIECKEATDAVVAASYRDVFKALYNPNSKCPSFVRSLPNDTSLHRLAREMEFVSLTDKLADRLVNINADSIVDPESNLKPVVLRKILFSLDLDHGFIDSIEGDINKMLSFRNDVAHGGRAHSIEFKTYEDLESAWKKVIDNLVLIVIDALKREAFRKGTSG